MKINWKLYQDRPVLKCEDRVISYAELYNSVLHVRAKLIEAGIQAGEPVGIYMAKSHEYIAVILALLSLKAIYVPLDTNSPEQRIEAIVDNCGLQWIICSFKAAENDSLEFATHRGITCMQIDCSEVDKTGVDTELEILDGSPEAPAALLYTSGSTGQPKGVTLTRGNIQFFTAWAVAAFGITEQDILISHAPFHFDISLLDLFGTFYAGASLVVIPYEKTANPQYLVKLAAAEKITIWQSVSSALVMMAEYGGMSEKDLSSFRHVLFTGERMSVKFLSRLIRYISSACWHNIYGATETNDTFIYTIESGQLPDPLPIGTPLPGVETLILDAEGKPVSNSAEGELYVAAPTVMAGYWPVGKQNDFIVFIDYNGKRYFKTRDIVHCDGAGVWHLHGRVDDIVKSGGNRVNLLEVEKYLLSHPAVLEAAVIPVADDYLGNKIIAYICTKDKKHLSSITLRQYCSEQLPRYMIPHHFSVQDERLLKTTSGKIDRTFLKQCSLGVS